MAAPCVTLEIPLRLRPAKKQNILDMFDIAEQAAKIMLYKNC